MKTIVKGDRMNHRHFYQLTLRVLVCLFVGGYISQANGADVRESILAGSWYPGNKDILARSIENFLSKADRKVLNGNLKAIIVPHAGHIYSGHVAAHAYRLLQGMDIQRVIMIGPSHRIGFNGVSVNFQSGYQTPLGIVPVDQTMVKKLVQTSDIIRYLPEAHSREHSLEIQLPFLQTVLDDFHIVPIIMGEQDLSTCSDLAQSLIKILGRQEKTLILASTDLSHFHHAKQAKELDTTFIRHVRALNPEGLAECLSSHTCEACGGGPVIATMLASRALGVDHVEILNYADSGDVSGDKNNVVGYISAALIKGFHANIKTLQSN